MRHTVKVVLLGCAIFVATSASTYALDTKEFQLKVNPFRTKNSTLVATVEEGDPTIDDTTEAKAADSTEKEKQTANKEADEEGTKEPTPKTHIIAIGENLSSIAERYNTTWIRIYAKNEVITNPDVVSVGMTVTIPEADEVLPDRELPVAPVVQAVQSTTTAPNNFSGNRYSAPAPTYASTASNTYAAGYCTWYAKNRRPDLPNMLGNAISWVSSAAARGYATGTTPRVGAIGQQGNHVVYVESVNADGTVSISEMNYGGALFVVHYRTVPASSFVYIY
jgi:surface antigen